MKSCRTFVSLIAAGVLALTGCGAPEPVLNVYIWSEYLPDEVVEAFTERTGIRVRVDTYDSNEVLLEKLQSGVADYDVVCPSDYMVTILAQEGLIRPLDAEGLPNMKHIDEVFQDPAYDPGNRHSIPYFWGTTGVGYNREALPEGVDSWATMFDPALGGRILMMDDVRECFAAALKFLGYSLNETNSGHLAEAAALLKKQKDLVLTYNSGDFANILAAGDVDIAHGYNGELAEVVDGDPERFAYVVPKEGGTMWVDNLCIAAGSRNADAALAFLNFTLEPEISAQLVNAMNYASANRAAREWIDPAILENPAVYPDDETLARCEVIVDIGPAMTEMDALWTEIKAQ